MDLIFARCAKYSGKSGKAQGEIEVNRKKAAFLGHLFIKE
jgi:hypothetical protein